jgi:hypothetical protein
MNSQRALLRYKTPRATVRPALRSLHPYWFGGTTRNFFCNASIEIILPARTCFLALSMILKNCETSTQRQRLSVHLSERYQSSDWALLLSENEGFFLCGFRNDKRISSLDHTHGLAAIQKRREESVTISFLPTWQDSFSHSCLLMAK